METVKSNCRTWLLHYIPSCVCVCVCTAAICLSWLCSSGSALAGPTDVHFNSRLSRWLRMQSSQATVRLIGSGCLFSSCTSQVWIQAHWILRLWLYLNPFFPPFSGKVWKPNRCRRSFPESQRGVAQQQYGLAGWSLVFCLDYFCGRGLGEAGMDLKKNEGLSAH